jgi:hypothetical protein
MQTTDLTRQQAIDAIGKGHKVAHTLFSDGEYIVSKKGVVVDEAGIELDMNDFWMHHKADAFNVGWYIIEEITINIYHK